MNLITKAALQAYALVLASGVIVGLIGYGLYRFLF